MATTIQIDPATRESLARLKSSPRETYDELLRKFLSLIPEGDEDGAYTDDFRSGLLESMVQARTGDTLSADEVKRRLGL